MREECLKLLNYITEAIDAGLSDEEIDERFEEVANNEQITPSEYFSIYEEAILVYKNKFMKYLS